MITSRTTSDIAKLQKAQVVIVNGAGYDAWAVKAAQSANATIVNAAEIGGVNDGENPHVWFSAPMCARRSHRPSPRAYEGTRPDAAKRADFDKLNQQWTFRRKTTSPAKSPRAKQKGGWIEAYAATESVAEAIWPGDLGLDRRDADRLRASHGQRKRANADRHQTVHRHAGGRARSACWWSTFRRRPS